MKDIMVDLETADNVPGGALFSCAAVQCDLTTGETGEEIHRNIDLQSCLDAGLTVSGDTIYWWLKQSNEARKSLDTLKKISLNEFCKELNGFVKFIADKQKISPKLFRVWGNGASFDNAFIRYAYRAVGQEFIVPFWNDRDVRTVVGFYPNNLFQDLKINIPRTESHNALHDAKYQVKYVSQIMKDLGVTELY
jgi:exodeoxyribonuclease VIII